mmetsp:Transcript_11543/g.17354  ORF Transcript_11543/g.17354 Transcript_11543/m.17354 type:complete len:100 (+) Transcript_11543:2448-2747(+)
MIGHRSFTQPGADVLHPKPFTLIYKEISAYLLYRTKHDCIRMHYINYFFDFFFGFVTIASSPIRSKLVTIDGFCASKNKFNNRSSSLVICAHSSSVSWS